ncbi:hypothetical protein [Rhizobium leguminosarum]|uniref:hypothetical protein n=1 Tax=Rhizobium leguminosarum TaxID=384 RepID=UPI0013B6F569|nr:hypothetical protein [Rhizobium leguminosarum]MBY5385223.1 hypothetical protein [Rhizobium leguminosarum]NEH73981.1 hypothetical protein [Rhizobium leguminosarum]
MSAISLDDLFRCDDHGSLVVAEDRLTKRSVHIRDAQRGKACDCVCPCCKRPLIARKGAINQHGFAHFAKDVKPSCSAAGETLLHKFAKEVLERHCYINRPEVVAQDDLGPIVVAAAQRIDFDRVELERREGNVVPDVVCYLGEHRLFVEFKVTHGIDEGKRLKLREHNVAVMEIDLSSYRHEDLQSLDTIILEHAPRKMVQSRLLDLREAKLAERRAAKRREMTEEARNLADLWKRQVPLLDPTKQSWYLEAVKYGFDNLVAPQNAGHSCFKIANQHWKLWVMEKLASRPADHSSHDLQAQIGHLGWVKSIGLRDITYELSEIIRAEFAADFRSPLEALKDYLMSLVKAGYLTELDERRFSKTTRFVNMVYERKQAVQVPERRKWEVATRVERIMTLLDEEVQGEFDLDAWLDKYCAGRKISVQSLLSGASTPMEILTGKLKDLLAAMSRPTAADRIDTIGLPVQRYLALRSESHRAMDAKLKAEWDAMAFQEGVLRGDEIEREATLSLSFDADLWLAQVYMFEGAEGTARDHARTSPAGLLDARTLLRQETERRANAGLVEQQRAWWREKLLVEAARILGNEEKAKLWCRSANRPLGMKWPETHCVDERTFQQCLDELPRPKRR